MSQINDSIHNDSEKILLIPKEILENNSIAICDSELSTNQKPQIAKSWLVDYLVKRRMAESDIRLVGGHIRTFGSYRLGVHTTGGDIDAVFITPMHVTRKDFFESFSIYLKSRSDVKNLRCIPDAYVPLMKFNFCNIEFDLLFCRIIRYKIDDEISFADVRILKEMEVRDIRSINGNTINFYQGFRLADEILSVIPSHSNFKVLLHCIKYWAKGFFDLNDDVVNDLYSNILGFFGGITWAILAARISQLYPCAVPSVLILKFFYLFAHWKWEEIPIVLKKIDFGPHGMTYPQWNLDAVDRNKLMSIVTPTYPEQNTCHNITVSTRTVITLKLKRAYEIVRKIMNNEESWPALFVPVNFFQTYLHFLILTIDSTTDVNLLEWSGFVESKIRHLILALEKNIFIKFAHPYSKSFPALPSEDRPYVKRWYIGMEINKSGIICVADCLDEDTHINIDLNHEILGFQHDVLIRCKGSLNFPGKKLSFLHVKRKDLKNYLPIDIIGRTLKKVKLSDAKRSQHSTPDVQTMKNLMPLSCQKRKASFDSIISSEPATKKSTSDLSLETKEYINGASACQIPLLDEPKNG
ncbi:hypothetical protein MXB_4555, partial [Myxobolus squamalis]